MIVNMRSGKDLANHIVFSEPLILRNRREIQKGEMTSPKLQLVHARIIISIKVSLHFLPIIMKVASTTELLLHEFCNTMKCFHHWMKAYKWWNTIFLHFMFFSSLLKNHGSVWWSDGFCSFDGPFFYHSFMQWIKLAPGTNPQWFLSRND